MGYLSNIANRLLELETTEDNELETISSVIAEKIGAGGIVHMFGCGHSSLIAQDAYYRAGGLVPIRPILIESLMLHKGAKRSSTYERKLNYVDAFLQEEDIREGDVLIIISTSGRNPAPIETAMYGKERGAFVIGMLSKAYSETQGSKHPSSKRLENVVDAVIDTKVPLGDAIEKIEGVDQAFSPASSVLGTAAIQAVLTKTIHHLVELGIDPPIFRSGNVDGSDEHNQKLIEKYQDRINF